MRRFVAAAVAVLVVSSVLSVAGSAAATPPPPTDEAVCEADSGLTARAEDFYERRRAAKPLNDWARWLLSVGVDVGAGAVPFTAEEMDGRVAVWAGWKPFAGELADYRACVAAQQPSGSQDGQQADTQDADDSQADPQAVGVPEQQQVSSCDTADAKTQASGGYNWHRVASNNGSSAAMAAVFYRALIAFKVSPLPAWTGSNVSGPAPTSRLTAAQARAAQGTSQWAGWTPILTALDCLETLADPANVRPGPNPFENYTPVFPTWANGKGCSAGAVAGNMANMNWDAYSARISSHRGPLPNYGGFFSNVSGNTDGNGGQRDNKVIPGHDSNSAGFCLLAGLEARLAYDSLCNNGERCTGHNTDRYRRAIMALIGLETADFLYPLTVREAEFYATDVPVRLTDRTEADWWNPVIAAMKIVRDTEPFQITLKAAERVYKHAWRSNRSYAIGDVVLDGGGYWRATTAHTSTHFGSELSRRPIYVNARAWTYLKKKPNEWGGVDQNGRHQPPPPPPVWDAVVLTYSHNGTGNRTLYLYSTTDPADVTAPSLIATIGAVKPNRERLRGLSYSCDGAGDRWQKLRQSTSNQDSPGDSPWVQVCTTYDGS